MVKFIIQALNVFTHHIKVMKKLLIFFILTTFGSVVYGQNGMYNCATQVYVKADNSEKTFYANKLIVTIDINQNLGGYISLHYPKDTLTYRYSILSNGETMTDDPKRTITKTYKAQMSQFNIPIGNQVLIGVIENMDSHKITFWIYNDKYKSYNEYFDLNKIE